MSTTAWPPALKIFVNATFAQATDSNRNKVEEELKSLIFHAYDGGNLETTDWSKVQLEW